MAELIRCKEASVQRMYDNRKEFIETVNRYYTRYLVTIAAIFYLVKFALDDNNLFLQRFFLLAASFLSFIIAYFVYQSRRLLKTVYFLYSSSAVTAAINSLAVGHWNHAWHDYVLQTAKELDTEATLLAGDKKANSKRIRDRGALKRDGVMSKREKIAYDWSTGPASILSINSRIHNALTSLLIVVAVITFSAALFAPKLNVIMKTNSAPTVDVEEASGSTVSGD